RPPRAHHRPPGKGVLDRGGARRAPPPLRRPERAGPCPARRGHRRRHRARLMAKPPQPPTALVVSYSTGNHTVTCTEVTGGVIFSAHCPQVGRRNGVWPLSPFELPRRGQVRREVADVILATLPVTASGSRLSSVRVRNPSWRPGSQSSHGLRRSGLCTERSAGSRRPYAAQPLPPV